MTAPLEGEPPQLPDWRPGSPAVMDLLARAAVRSIDLIPWGSNYTFLARLDGGAAGEGLAVYKPQRGEAPLWDFPDGTLYRRERAAYLVSEALGWGFIPPTIIREGPHGTGSVQLFIPSFKGASYFTFRDERAPDLQVMALFDCLTNNADRKAGHCLLGVDGHVWGIDHGLTFNHVPKLRTVIWEFKGTPIPPNLVEDMRAFALDLATAGTAAAQLQELIVQEEMEALNRRLTWLIEESVFPEPGGRRSVPWPPM